MSPNALNFPAGSSYSKTFLYQLGTAGSSLLPNIVTLDVANSVADAYLQPASVMVPEQSGPSVGVASSAGKFDAASGCYNIIGSAAIHFALEAAVQLHHPVFCVTSGAGWAEQRRGDQVVGASIGGRKLLPREVAAAVEVDDAGPARLVVQILRTLPPGRHEIRFEGPTVAQTHSAMKLDDASWQAPRRAGSCARGGPLLWLCGAAAGGHRRVPPGPSVKY